MSRAKGSDQKAGESRWKKIRIPCVGGPYKGAHLCMFEGKKDASISAIAERVPFPELRGAYLLKRTPIVLKKDNGYTYEWREA